jgi:hypothetical protein
MNHGFSPVLANTIISNPTLYRFEKASGHYSKHTEQTHLERHCKERYEGRRVQSPGTGFNERLRSRLS